MKVVILAGGFGTRLSEETDIRPKPMVEIGGKPIIWHIMKYYSEYGFNDFVICLGYKGYFIKEFFANFKLHQTDVTVDFSNNNIKYHKNSKLDWKVTLVDSGLDTNTAGRLLSVKEHLSDEFLLTYGDGLSNVNITKLVESHKKSNCLVTVTAVQPQGRYGALQIGSNNIVENFFEKPIGDGNWVNGGFFVVKKEAIDFINDYSESWEITTLPKILKKQQLNSFKHKGFWQAMDTLRDKNYLNQLWQNEKTPWKIW